MLSGSMKPMKNKIQSEAMYEQGNDMPANAETGNDAICMIQKDDLRNHIR